MSELTRVMYPRSHIVPDTMKTHVVRQGGSRVNQQIFPSNSWGSPGAPLVQASWNVSPPSTQTIVDRNIRIKAYLEVVVDQPLQIGTNDGLRQFPLSAITDVITMQVNGETLSQNTADLIAAMNCYHNDAYDRNRAVSTSPAMQDQYQKYSDWQLYGSARNPLADYGENSGEMSRGGFPVTIAPDGLSFRCELTEPLFLSPFLSGQDEDEGMVNVNQLNLSVRWVQLTNRVLCHSSAGNAITAVSASFYQAPEVLVNYITPMITYPLPTVQTFPYSKLQQYIKPVGNFTAGSSQTLISDSIKLSLIPHRMYAYVRHARSSSNYTVADSFAKISRMSVLWNNQSGLLSTASEQELFDISSRNDCNLSYPQWDKYRGSVMCVEFGKDIGLQANEAAGVSGQFTVQVQIEATNLDDTGDYEFFLLMDQPGTFSIFENGARASIGNFSESMVLSAQQGDTESSHAVYTALHGGRLNGRFMKGFKNFVHRFSSGLGSIANMAAPIVGALAPELSPALGLIQQIAPQVAQASQGSGRTTGGRLSRRMRR
jgi:hypothetical protein